MSDSDRLTLRLGPLADPLRAYAEDNGISPSEAIRVAIARLLGEPVPQLQIGDPELGSRLGKVGAKARWGRRNAT